MSNKYLVEQIVKISGDFFDITPKEILGKGRDDQTVKARWVSQWVVRKLFGMPYTSLAKYYNSDHATLIHAIKSLEQQHKENIHFKSLCYTILKKCGEITVPTFDQLAVNEEFKLNKNEKNTYRKVTPSQAINNLTHQPENFYKSDEVESVKEKREVAPGVNALDQKYGGKHDAVNHPKHYNSSPAKCSNCGHPIECIDVTQHMGFNIGNTVKYCWRSEHKNGLEDLKKAVWYLNKEIEKLEKRGK